MSIHTTDYPQNINELLNHLSANTIVYTGKDPKKPLRRLEYLGFEEGRMKFTDNKGATLFLNLRQEGEGESDGSEMGIAFSERGFIFERRGLATAYLYSTKADEYES